jgi:hypothetical protein
VASHPRCSRCHEERPGGLEPTTAAPAGGSVRLQDVPEGAWASFDGHDVCPECQTSQERAEVGRRIVEAVEREVERRQRDGLEPEPTESPLIDYAMALRAAEQRSGTSATPEPDLVADDLRRARLRVALTGAFLTGQALEVSLESYGRLQGQLERSLERSHWTVRGLHAGVGTYQSGGGFTRSCHSSSRGVTAARSFPRSLPRSPTSANSGPCSSSTHAGWPSTCTTWASPS